MHSSLTTVILCLALFQLPPAVGIQPLNDAGVQEAIEFASTRDATRNLLRVTVLTAVRMRDYNFRPLKDDAAWARVKAATGAPFDVFVDTPFARAVIAVLEGPQFEYPSLDVDKLNADKVVVVVSHGKSRLPTNVIQDVIIQRGGETIRPLKRSVQKTVVRNHLGAAVPSAVGRFTFDFAAFEPTSTITLVLIGKAGNFNWEVTSEELALLR